MGKRNKRRNRNRKKYFYGTNIGKNVGKNRRNNQKSREVTTPQTANQTTTVVSPKYQNRKFDLQPILNPANVVRTKKGCFEFHHSDAWGTTLIPVVDQDALDITDKEIGEIKLIKDFPKLPYSIWSRWIRLCFHFCPDKTVHQNWGRHNYVHGSELEVEIILCRSEDNASWRAFVPLQEVTGASIQANLQHLCDIETGETFSDGIPPGWVHAGSSHSHNFMDAFFSGTDDANELGFPGLHIVIGNINKQKKSYKAKASIVLRHQRKNISLKDVVFCESDEEGSDFHPQVLNFVKKVHTRVIHTPPGVAVHQLHQIHGHQAHGHQAHGHQAHAQRPTVAPPQTAPAAPKKTKSKKSQGIIHNIRTFFGFNPHSWDGFDNEPEEDGAVGGNDCAPIALDEQPDERYGRLPDDSEEPDELDQLIDYYQSLYDEAGKVPGSRPPIDEALEANEDWNQSWFMI